MLFRITKYNFTGYYRIKQILINKHEILFSEQLTGTDFVFLTGSWFIRMKCNKLWKSNQKK